MIEQEQLQRFAPKAVQHLDSLNEAVERAELNTLQRLTMFMGQLAHETGGFVYMGELWGPTPAQLRYERDFTAAWPPTATDRRNRLAYTLGNSEHGDGSKFRGHGLIQCTGRANHKACSLAIFGDTRLLDDPKILATPKYAALSAAWFWSSRGINNLVHDIELTTKRINGGQNGLDDRKKWLAKAQAVWGGA